MSKSKHSEAQIIGVLKQVEAGRSVEDVARDQGVSKHTIYAWKSKYGGMEVSEAQEVKQLREENSRLKKLVADLSLVGSALNIQYGCTATQNNGKITSQSDVMSGEQIAYTYDALNRIASAQTTQIGGLLTKGQGIGAP